MLTLFRLNDITRVPRGGGKPQKPWVSEITNLCPRFGYGRQFLAGKRDASEANTRGTRGVVLWYYLEPGKAFEVYEVRERKSPRRYFIETLEDGSWEEIDESRVKVVVLVNAVSELMSSRLLSEESRGHLILFLESMSRSAEEKTPV